MSALINLVLSVSFAPTTRLTERGAGLLLGYDVAQLAFLLALTGGLQNPFSIRLLVPVTLSATILSLRTTVVLCFEVIVIATLLGLFPTDLPWYGGVFRLPALYLLGFWIALVLGTALIAGYAWRVADDARRLSDALAATQMALAREQRDDLDAGGLFAELSAWQIHNFADDEGQGIAEFLGADGDLLDTIATPLQHAGTSGWIQVTTSGAVPPGSRQVRIKLRAVPVGGTVPNVAFDDLTLIIGQQATGGAGGQSAVLVVVTL